MSPVASQNVESSTHDRDDDDDDEDDTSTRATTGDISRQSLLDSDLVHLIEASKTAPISREFNYNWSMLLRLDLSRNLLRDLPEYKHVFQ